MITYIFLVVNICHCDQATLLLILRDLFLFKLEKSLNCETCINALTGIDNSTLHSLIRLKSKGDLVHPSDDVINMYVM